MKSPTYREWTSHAGIIKRMEARLRKQGFIPEHELIDEISHEWGVKPARIRHQLRSGMGMSTSRRFRYTIKEIGAGKTRIYVEPLSARKWLLFALDRIPDEWVMSPVEPDGN